MCSQTSQKPHVIYQTLYVCQKANPPIKRKTPPEKNKRPSASFRHQKTWTHRNEDPGQQLDSVQIHPLTLPKNLEDLPRWHDRETKDLCYDKLWKKSNRETSHSWFYVPSTSGNSSKKWNTCRLQKNIPTIQKHDDKTSFPTVKVTTPTSRPFPQGSEASDINCETWFLNPLGPGILFSVLFLVPTCFK